ncbi:type IV toxin-antitoxin system AbiEi family antitoxin domain-containing protein [Halorhabdus amylolytica]|uniref:type IV toxin-antitoxin system AbiEi family antitoxin domain-containing protein n=1 Tax=Halorhabdus amylolytica TaxID=2559573 RepID=UPI0010A9DDFB|nr:type IV toxin-antitoxin system AbiEi family antitoxin [Halorhabdus amylolytica]
MGTNSEESIKSGLSKREALALTRLAAQNKTVITISDIQNALDISNDKAKKIAYNLEKKKWLDRLKRGVYLIVPLEAGEKAEYTEHEYVIVSHLADPMYISYWTALNYHNLTEQVPLTVYAATTSRVPAQQIHNVEYKFVTVTEEKFFGYNTELVNKTQKVKIADIQKTLVDCADHPEYCGGITELAKAVSNAGREEVDWAIVSEYLLEVGNGAAIKRIVYLTDLFDIDLPRKDELKEAFTAGYSKLDPTREDQGKHSSEYRLRLNVSKEEIREAGEQR